MNDRIKELGEQAEKLADEATNAHNDYTGQWKHSWNDVYDQKLAELIIKECLQFVKPDDSCSAEASMILEVTATQIKKHFGVE